MSGARGEDGDATTVASDGPERAPESPVGEAAALADPDGGLPGFSRAAPLVAVSIVVVMVAAIAVPYLLDSIQRRKQDRTMSALRSIGTAVESYQVDRGHVPTLAGPAMPTALLDPVLVPTYMLALSHVDAWGHALMWQHATPAAIDYSVWSAGKDGRAEVALAALGATTNFNRDIYFSNGQFAIAPEGWGD